jgi:hypothetical protein
VPIIAINATLLIPGCASHHFAAHPFTVLGEGVDGKSDPPDWSLRGADALEVGVELNEDQGCTTNRVTSTIAPATE